MVVNIVNWECIIYYIDDILEQVIEKLEGDNFFGLGYSFIFGFGWEYYFDGFIIMIQLIFQFWFSGLFNDLFEQYNCNFYFVGVRIVVKFQMVFF